MLLPGKLLKKRKKKNWKRNCPSITRQGEHRRLALYVAQRPPDTFDSPLPARNLRVLVQTIGALLKKKSDRSRRSSCGGGGGGGGVKGKLRAEGSSPASASTMWSRPKSVGPTSAGPPKRNPNRYVPPAARARALLESSKASAGAKDGDGSITTAVVTIIPAAATPAAAGTTATPTAATITATLTATVTTSATATVTTDSRRVAQPWRSSARTGLTGERGPDVDESGRAVENACAGAGGGVGVGVGAILRAGRRNAAEAPPQEKEEVGAGSGLGVRAAVCCSPTGGMEEPDGAGFDGFGDLPPDVFALGDDWGRLSFDAAAQQPHSLGAGGAD